MGEEKVMVTSKPYKAKVSADIVYYKNLLKEFEHARRHLRIKSNYDDKELKLIEVVWALRDFEKV
jgi:hypothetical protein